MREYCQSCKTKRCCTKNMEGGDVYPPFLTDATLNAYQRVRLITQAILSPLCKYRQNEVIGP